MIQPFRARVLFGPTGDVHYGERAGGVCGVVADAEHLYIARRDERPLRSGNPRSGNVDVFAYHLRSGAVRRLDVELAPDESLYAVLNGELVISRTHGFLVRSHLRLATSTEWLAFGHCLSSHVEQDADTALIYLWLGMDPSALACRLVVRDGRLCADPVEPSSVPPSMDRSGARPRVICASVRNAAMDLFPGASLPSIAFSTAPPFITKVDAPAFIEGVYAAQNLLIHGDSGLVFWIDRERLCMAYGVCAPAVGWSPGRHRLYDPERRAQARELLVINAHARARLSSALLLLIITRLMERSL